VSPRNRRSSRRTSRSIRRLGGVLVALIVLAVVGYFGGAERIQEWLPDDSSGGSGAPITRGEVDADRARAQLAELTVAEWGSMSGYSRDEFPHWRLADGCNVRHVVLARDGKDIVNEDGSCKVIDGTWVSVYDGATLTDPGEVDIDHMVPLANAWRTGAASWTDQQRAEFANDLERPQLFAVSATSNRAKGDQDPSQWKPPLRTYWCQYAHDWIAVKHHWELSVTAAERDALDDMLDTCE
jgi:hypothetical protein